jgi:hypothetical protein
MALWTCRKCTTQFAVGLPYCPHCTGTDIDTGDDEMAKITVHGGPSDVNVPGGLVETEAEAKAEAEVVAEAEHYRELTVSQLRVEIDRRNADRSEDSKIVPDGTLKVDLVVALEDDDEVAAGNDNPADDG